jgi:hypothetical protein
LKENNAPLFQNNLAHIRLITALIDIFVLFSVTYINFDDAHFNLFFQQTWSCDLCSVALREQNNLNFKGNIPYDGNKIKIYRKSYEFAKN